MTERAQEQHELFELAFVWTLVNAVQSRDLAFVDALRSLDVRYSRVTASGARELLARIPGVRVLVDDPSKGAARRAVDAAPVKGKGEEAVAKWLRSIGAEIESEPREYDYAPHYYAVFFRDPSGIKLELVHSPG